MSDSSEMNRILDQLAAGTIDTEQAAARLAQLQSTPAPRPDISVESLYDTPPARVLPEPEPIEDAEAPQGEVPGEHIDESPTAETASGPDDTDEKVVFSFDIDDVAATAGEVFGHAGDFAKSAFQRLGSLASTVLNDGPRPAGEATRTEPSGPTGNKGVERLVLRSVGRRVRLVGDPKVATISVDGPHTLRRQGVTLEINTEGELGLNLDGFSVLRPPRNVDDLRALGFGRELVIRVNPAIPVDAEVTGSRLTTVDVPYLGKIRVSAGAASLSGVVEITDALMQAGGASLSGPLSSGRSRVRVESGNLSVRLTEGANVTIRSTVQLGRVSWPGEPHGNLDEFVVGNGSAQLEINVVMGRAVVRSDA